MIPPAALTGHEGIQMARRSVLRLSTAAAAAALAVSACGGGHTSSSSSSTSAAGGPASSSSAGPKLTKSPIRIGTPGTYSGSSGESTKPAADALNAWASWTNAQGGINGHPVQVIVKDDGGSASKALANVKSLVEDDHVVAIVSDQESGLDSSWASYIQSKQIPVIGGSATGIPWLTNPYFFPAGANSVSLLTGIAYTTKLAGKSKYGLVYCAEFPACAQAGTLTSSIA
jgi:branched-chain amino acid transport system substrate-binding protein